MSRLLNSLLFLSAFLATPSGSATSTVVDVLSRESRFSSLLRALQVAQLIPYLNNRTDDGRTIFAPNNEAFDKREAAGPRVGREWLQYHIVPSILLLGNLTDGRLLQTSLVLDGSLGSENAGQRLKVSRHEDGRVFLGQAVIVEGNLTADNGVVHEVDAVLEMPIDIVKTLSLTEGIAKLRNAMDMSGFWDLLTSTSPWTVFAPIDSAFDDIPPLTRQYLATAYAKDDLQIILKYHTHRGAYYMDELPVGTTSIPAMTWGSHEIIKANQGGEITYDRAPLLKTDIVASNGAVHVIPHVFLPSPFEMNALKYLIGMNRTKFVDLFFEAELTQYLTRHSPAAPITVFAVSNEALEDSAVLSKDQLLYHVVPGRRDIDSFRDNSVIETALKTKGLYGQAQVLQVVVTRNGEDHEVLINDARIIGEPVIIDGAIIYTLSHMLRLPLDPLQVILSDLNLSTFAAAVHIAELERDIRTHPGTTMFVPSNDAFKRDSALMSYLLLPDVAADLRAVVRYHVATRALYASDLRRTAKDPSNLSITTLAGQNITLRRGENRGDLALLGSQPHVARFRTSPPRNRLTANGNIFVIERVMLPDVDITVRNLLMVLNAQTFIQLVSDHLSGDAFDAPRDDPVTVLVPSEAAFAHVDLDSLGRDPARMACSVKMHFVRGRAELADGGVWDTLCETGWVKVRSLGDDEWVLDVVDKSGQAVGPKRLGRARVRSRGEVRNGNVYEVDRFLHLPESSGLAAHWIILIIMGCLALVAAAFGLWRYVQLRRRRAGYEEIPHSGNEVVPRSGNEVVPRSGTEVVPRSGTEVVPRSGNEEVPPSGNEEVREPE